MEDALSVREIRIVCGMMFLFVGMAMGLTPMCPIGILLCLIGGIITE